MLVYSLYYITTLPHLLFEKEGKKRVKVEKKKIGS